jgi:hypothetical protein
MSGFTEKSEVSGRLFNPSFPAITEFGERENIFPERFSLSVQSSRFKPRRYATTIERIERICNELLVVMTKIQRRCWQYGIGLCALKHSADP